jgi:AraC-like DNA-binding protein
LEPHHQSNDLRVITDWLGQRVINDGYYVLSEGNLEVTRASSVSSEQTNVLTQPCVCIVSQGAKLVTAGKGSLQYVENESSMVVYASEIPIRVAINRASEEHPYFCLMVPLTARRISEVASRLYPNGIPKAGKESAVYVRESVPQIVNAIRRMLQNIDDPKQGDLLIPLAIEEVVVRLLCSDIGPAIAQMGVSDSHTAQINQAISWLKKHYTLPMRVEELARDIGMSVSSFHAHFKAIVGITPLQFQKTLRLQAARRLIISNEMDVSLAAFEVGYASTSQFSREYVREFGIAPSRDSSLVP